MSASERDIICNQIRSAMADIQSNYPQYSFFAAVIERDEYNTVIDQAINDSNATAIFEW